MVFILDRKQAMNHRVAETGKSATRLPLFPICMYLSMYICKYFLLPLIENTVYIQELSDLKKALSSEMEQLTLVKEIDKDINS